MKILVVDDEASMRGFCEAVLRSADYEVESVASGEEAVGEMIRHWDIVLTDIHMPGLVDGIEVVERVCEASTTDVIVMTSAPELKTAIKALRAGAYDYLVKPFNADGLLLTIQRCAEKRRLSRELAIEKRLRQELQAAYDQLKQAEKIKETFGQFATPEVAAFVLKNPLDFWNRGERIEVTVLFADVRGFTPYSQSVPPEMVVQSLNKIFHVVVENVNKHGGILNKFIGDGMLAVFGAPVRAQNHPLAAVKAALGAQAAVDGIAVRTEGEGGRPLRIGIGINTGEVVAGCLGTRTRTEYSVIGSAVNIASRLESLAEPGAILIGPETAARLGDAVELIAVGEGIRLKGVSEAMHVYRVAGTGAAYP